MYFGRCLCRGDQIRQIRLKIWHLTFENFAVDSSGLDLPRKNRVQNYDGFKTFWNRASIRYRSDGPIGGDTWIRVQSVRVAGEITGGTRRRSRCVRTTNSACFRKINYRTNTYDNRIVCLCSLCTHGYWVSNRVL